MSVFSDVHSRCPVFVETSFQMSRVKVNFASSSLSLQFECLLILKFTSDLKFEFLCCLKFPPDRLTWFQVCPRSPLRNDYSVANSLQMSYFVSRSFQISSLNICFVTGSLQISSLKVYFLESSCHIFSLNSYFIESHSRSPGWTITLTHVYTGSSIWKLSLFQIQMFQMHVYFESTSLQISRLKVVCTCLNSSLRYPV